VSRRRPQDLRALTALELAADGAPPSEFRIFAYGKNASDKGEFIFDEKAAKLVMAAFAKKGSRLTMDYEHQALNAPDNGREAPNSCYSWTPEIRMNEAGKPELWAANAKWTEKAAAHIKAKEYLYFSPAFETESEKSLRVARIVNMALTNIPALDNLEPLVAASQGERPMPKKMLCVKCSTSLRFPTDDDDGDEVACKACSSASGAKLTALSAVIGLKADANSDTITEAIRGLSSFRSAVVSTLGVASVDEAMGQIVALKAKAGEVEKLTAQIAKDKDEALTKELDAILAAAGEAGKIAPAELEARVKPILALSGGKPTKENIAVIKDVLGATLPKVETTATAKKPDGEGGNVALTSADLQIARLTGIAPNDVIEHLKKTAKGDYKGMNKPLSCILQP
jgi:phage I-like protein